MAENRTFGEWLRWLRERTGRSQTYMADVLGVHSSQISRWEHGRMRPTPDQLVRIIQFLRDERPARIPPEEWEQYLQRLEESYGQNPILSSMIETLFQRSQKLPQLRAMIQKFLADLYEILGGLIATDEAIQGRLWETANHQLQQLTNKLEDNHFSDRLSLELNRRKSFVYYRLLRYDRALETIDQVIAQAKKIRDLRAQGEVLVLRGDLNRRMGKFDGARQDFRTALECYDQLNGPEGIYGKVRCYRKMAITYLLQGWPQRAEHVLSLARAANTQRGDFTEAFKIQQAQAWIYLQQGRWDQAVAAHQEVVARLQARQDLDPWVLAKAFRYMGDAYRIARQYEKAEDSYNTAQQICNQLRAEGRDTRLIEAMIALGLARIKLRQPDMRQAQAWIERAKQFIEAIQMDSRIPEAKMELAELMWQLNDHQQSWTLLGEAQKQFEQFKHWAYYAQCQTIICQWLVAEAGDQPSDEDWDQVTEGVNEIYKLAFDPQPQEKIVDAEDRSKALPERLSDEIPLLYYHLAIAKKEQGRLGLWMGKTKEGEQALKEALTYASKFNSRFLQEVFEAIKQLFKNLGARNSRQTAALRRRFHQWLAAHEDPYLRRMADQI